LLENGFSLLFGAYYFEDVKLYNKAKKILIAELNEQILDDGAHFELSPMYHQLMLLKVMDCVNLVKNNSYKNQELLYFLKEKADIMLDWINAMTFRNGDIPLFNDSAKHIAPTTSELNDYAKKLNLNSQRRVNNHLTVCGYRKYVQSRYELIVDMGNIGPNYIPGHAHADTFNFELHVDNKPFIVDTGISTYEKNELRQRERSTESHNTVVINDTNQSQVWGGFRVGERAKIIEIRENENQIIACHDGYKNLGVFHKRLFKTRKKNIKIKDFLIGKKVDAKAYIHFHPCIRNIFITSNHIHLLDIDCHIQFKGTSLMIEKKTYNYAFGFNKTQKSIVLEVSFKEELITAISIN
ncbi:heparinase II/III family protein, partial [Candidatus Woesearchaeota archaeon]|nr:heparinase II/III family protein [Candidatus Woesearchaeota archaeon]